MKMTESLFGVLGDAGGLIRLADGFMSLLHGMIGKEPLPENATKTQKAAGLYKSLMSDSNEIGLWTQVTNLEKKPGYHDARDYIGGLVKERFLKYKEQGGVSGTLAFWWFYNSWSTNVLKREVAATKVGTKTVTTTTDKDAKSKAGKTTVSTTDIKSGGSAGGVEFLKRIIDTIKAAEATSKKMTAEEKREDGYDAAIAMFKVEGVPHMPDAATLMRFNDLINSVPDFVDWIESMITSTPAMMRKISKKIDDGHENMLKERKNLKWPLQWLLKPCLRRHIMAPQTKVSKVVDQIAEPFKIPYLLLVAAVALYAGNLAVLSYLNYWATPVWAARFFLVTLVPVAFLVFWPTTLVWVGGVSAAVSWLGEIDGFRSWFRASNAVKGIPDGVSKFYHFVVNVLCGYAFIGTIFSVVSFRDQPHTLTYLMVGSVIYLLGSIAIRVPTKWLSRMLIAVGVGLILVQIWNGVMGKAYEGQAFDPNTGETLFMIDPATGQIDSLNRSPSACRDPAFVTVGQEYDYKNFGTCFSAASGQRLVPMTTADALKRAPATYPAQVVKALGDATSASWHRLNGSGGHGTVSVDLNTIDVTTVSLQPGQTLLITKRRSHLVGECFGAYWEITQNWRGQYNINDPESSLINVSDAMHETYISIAEPLRSRLENSNLALDLLVEVGKC